MWELIKSIKEYLVWPSAIIVFLWLSFFLNLNYQFNWNAYGIHPRQIHGLLGVVFSPFLHADFGHLFHNSIPFFISFSFIFFFYKQKSWAIALTIFLGSGIGVWLFGKYYSNHIGASGIVYGFVSFLIFSGFLLKNKKMWAMSLLMIFLYGSLIWGIFPQINIISGAKISWEGHACGAITGFLSAFYYRKYGPPSDLDNYFGDEDDLEYFSTKTWVEDQTANQ